MIQIVTLEDAAQARGLVVVVDVIRAFTTAAFAFASGAQALLPVGTVDEAFALRDELPDALLTGEVDALPVSGFDFSNSPAEMEAADLGGLRLVQRTSSGTQGVLRCRDAERLLVASFACAQATAERIRLEEPEEVTFVVTGPDDADEDRSCAEYLAAALQGTAPAAQPYLDRVCAASAAQKFLDPEQPEYPAQDMPRCIDLDRFDFSMEVIREDGRLVIRAT